VFSLKIASIRISIQTGLMKKIETMRCLSKGILLQLLHLLSEFV